MSVSKIPLIKGDKVGIETDYRDNLPVNMTAIVKPIRGANGYMLSHPGLELFGNSVGKDRGAQWNARQEKHFRVSGSDLVTVDKTGASTSVGVISGAQQASLAYSFNSQAVVADGKMFLYDGATLTEVVDPNLGNPIDITWIDGFYVMTDGENIYHTDIDDETAIADSQFDTSQFSPDPTMALDKTSDDQLIIFDRYTTIYMVQTSDVDFAFTWIKGKSIKVGIVGTHCETELEGVFYLLGGGPEEATSIHYISAGTYIPIATREIDIILEEYVESELAKAVLETRTEKKDKFIIVRLPRHTLLYNKTVALAFGNDFAWTILKTGIDDGPWRGVNGVYDPRISAWIYGDTEDYRLGRLNSDIVTQYGEKVECLLYSPLMNLEAQSIDQLEVDTIPGHQINNDETKVSISLTYDGISYGKEWFTLYGEIHEYNQRFIMNRLGYVRYFFGYKLRAVTSEKLAFSLSRVTYG